MILSQEDNSLRLNLTSSGISDEAIVILVKHMNALINRYLFER